MSTEESLVFENPFESLMLDVLADPEDDAFRRRMVGEGYFAVRKLPSGVWIGGHEFLFTWAVVVGLRRTGYDFRFCYPKSEYFYTEVCDFIAQWDGEGFPPGHWLKRKGAEGGDLTNPERGKGKFYE